MDITDIRIRKLYQEGRLRALVSITVGGDLAVHDIKVIEGPERLFVAMPSRKEENGSFRDVVILNAYQEVVASGEGAEPAQSPADFAATNG